MPEGIQDSLEHGCELIAHTLKQLLDGGGVADERDSHLEATRWDVALAPTRISSILKTIQSDRNEPAR